jgi:hypothetical protein
VVRGHHPRALAVGGQTGGGRAGQRFEDRAGQHDGEAGQEPPGVDRRQEQGQGHQGHDGALGPVGVGTGDDVGARRDGDAHEAAGDQGGARDRQGGQVGPQRPLQPVGQEAVGQGRQQAALGDRATGEPLQLLGQVFGLADAALHPPPGQAGAEHPDEIQGPTVHRSSFHRRW